MSHHEEEWDREYNSFYAVANAINKNTEQLVRLEAAVSCTNQLSTSRYDVTKTFNEELARIKREIEKEED